jgi:hypothetical protein
MAVTSVFPRTQRIGILVFDGFEPIDVWGFVEAFAIARFSWNGLRFPAVVPIRDLPNRRTDRVGEER